MQQISATLFIVDSEFSIVKQDVKGWQLQQYNKLTIRWRLSKLFWDTADQVELVMMTSPIEYEGWF